MVGRVQVCSNEGEETFIGGEKIGSSSFWALRSVQGVRASPSGFLIHLK